MKFDIRSERKNIAQIDRNIAKLFVKRMNAAKNIAIYKKKNGLKIYDKGQEERVIANGLKSVTDTKLKEYYYVLIKNIIKLSKKFQRSVN